jgi:predicted amidohydrolase
VGSRLENKLQHLTVCLPPSSDYSVEVVEVGEYVRAVFENCPSPKFGVVPFRAASDALDIEVSQRVPGSRPVFRAAAADDPAASDRLTALLDMAARAQVDVLVFPELSFTPALLDQLRDELERLDRESPAIKLVVAGTVNDGERNVCHLLGPDGTPLWQQPKMNRFVLEPGELEQGPSEIVRQGGVEDIDISDRRIRVADLPFGRVAVLVCLDFILPETHALLANMQVNCIFVPAMAPQRRRFETLAWAHAAASEATTFFCNAPNCPRFSPKARSFVYTPEKRAEPQSIDGAEPWEHSMLVFQPEPRVVETLRLQDLGGRGA